VKRRFLSLLLAAALTFSLSGFALAAIIPSKTYNDHFRDVSASAWYAPYVQSLYELGLTVGQTYQDTFAPHANMTVAEVLTMCARLRSLYDHGSSETGPAAFEAGSSWYARYVSYLQSLEIIDREFEGQYGQEATRAQMAHILAGTLPSEELSPINMQAVTVGYASRCYITDVDDYTPYQQDILTLYRAGILNGTDSSGSFLPQENIQRCHVAAMVTRLAVPSLRIALDWDTSLSPAPGEASFQSLVISDGTFHPAPAAADKDAIDDNIRYMLSRGERRMVLNYPSNSLTQEKANRIMSAFLSAAGTYLEQTYNSVRCSYSPQSGSLILTFSSSLYDERMIDSYREAILQKADAVRHQLWQDGAITDNSTDTQKARAYYQWLCGNCRYDYDAGNTSISHSAYSVFANGTAVCDGFTAAYNLLLKLEGIPCSAVSRSDHVWTAATLDGKSCHIDVTWGAQDSAVSYLYFGMTEAESLSRFS